MYVPCPSCRQQLFTSPALAGKEARCPSCQELVTIPAPHSVSDTATGSRPPERHATPSLAPIRELVSNSAAAMHLAVVLGCLKDVEDEELKWHEVMNIEARWKETFHQFHLEVGRPHTGVAVLPVLCPHCNSDLKIKVRSQRATQTVLLAYQFVWAAVSVLPAILLASMSTPPLIYIAIAGFCLSVGLWVLGRAIYRASVRPATFDSLGEAVVITRDTEREKDLQRHGSSRQHKLVEVIQIRSPANSRTPS